MAGIRVGLGGALLLCHTVGTVVLNTWRRREERSVTMMDLMKISKDTNKYTCFQRCKILVIHLVHKPNLIPQH